MASAGLLATPAAPVGWSGATLAVEVAPDRTAKQVAISGIMTVRTATWVFISSRKSLRLPASLVVRVDDHALVLEVHAVDEHATASWCVTRAHDYAE